MSTPNEPPADRAPAAAEIALVMSDCMNLLFFFAAPRVLATVRHCGAAGLDRASALATLRRFLRSSIDIRARASSVTPDVDRLIQAAMIVEEIAGAIPVESYEEALPAEVVEPARRALAVLGFVEPKGGWDEFEGFSIPYPPPRPLY